MCAANLGTIGLLSVLILASGVGAGIANPGANNACIELMPEKVATIMGLRGMFRTIGGAAGIFIITFILHLSSSPVTGFKITFISFGLALLFAIPLVLMVPDGRSEGT
jgi:MFS family permease